MGLTAGRTRGKAAGDGERAPAGVTLLRKTHLERNARARRVVDGDLRRELLVQLDCGVCEWERARMEPGEGRLEAGVPSFRVFAKTEERAVAHAASSRSASRRPRRDDTEARDSPRLVGRRPHKWRGREGGACRNFRFATTTKGREQQGVTSIRASAGAMISHRNVSSWLITASAISPSKPGSVRDRQTEVFGQGGGGGATDKEGAV